MKSLKLTLIATALLFSTSVMAEEIKSASTAAPSQEQKVLPKETKSKKKKVAMCGECGKPESACECDHSKHDDKHDDKHNHKKDEKKEEKK